MRHAVKARGGVILARSTRRRFTSGIAILCAAAAFAGAWAGCGSDGPTGPRGKYALTGTATLDDQTDYSGIRLRIVETGATVTTTADGSFALSSLEDGDYTLKASKDFYSTLTRNLQIRNGLLVDPIGELHLTRTFFLYMESDSLHYTFKSDSVFVWMVVQNDDVEPLNLFDGFVFPYDFIIYDPSEADKIVWQWSPLRPHRNDDKYDFHRTVPAADTIRINPTVAWDKKTMLGRLVPVGSYDVEGQLDLVDSRGKMWHYVTAKHRVEIEP
jgi:hypothetical protein